MKKYLLIALVLVVSLSLGIIFFMRVKQQSDYQNKGNQLVKQVEDYRATHNKLPNKLMDLGLEEPMNEGPYYEKTDSISYKVYFNIGFDDSMVYDSKSKKWVEGH